MITDTLGKQIAEVIRFATEIDPQKFVKSFCSRIREILGTKLEASNCEGIGMVVPGMLDRKSSVVLHAPTLGWRDVNLLSPLQAVIWVR